MVTQRPFSITGMDLSGYMTKDAPRAIAFYRDVLGIEPVTVYPDDRGADSNGILFAIDDFDSAVADVKERGIPFLMETETPMCRMAMINDTKGNIVTLHKCKAS